MAAEVRGLAELVQASEAALSDLVFLGATVVFLVTLEGRIKRQRVLRWLYQLRSVAHIVDSASRASWRPGVLAVRKKILSNCFDAAAFSIGNSVPTVLPMPVGAWASRGRLLLAER